MSTWAEYDGDFELTPVSTRIGALYVFLSACLRERARQLEDDKRPRLVEASIASRRLVIGFQNIQATGPDAGLEPKLRV